MGPVSSKNSIRKRVFLDGRNFAPGHFCPQLCLLVRLAKKTGEVQFNTKIQTENVIFGKTNSRGLLRQNWAKFSFGTILPPNAPYSQLRLEKRYAAGSIKNFQPKHVFLDERNITLGHFCPQSCHLDRLAHKIGDVWFSTKIQTENVFFGKTNSRGLLRQNWAMFSSRTILPPNTKYSQLGLEKRFGAGFINKFQPKTCFLGWMKHRTGTLLTPIVPSSPFAQENRWGAI